MKLKNYFLVTWVTASLSLGFLVNWRITVPLNDHGYLMVKDEANWWQRILISALVACLFSAVNTGLLALLRRGRTCCSQGLSQVDQVKT